MNSTIIVEISGLTCFDELCQDRLLMDMHVWPTGDWAGLSVPRGSMLVWFTNPKTRLFTHSGCLGFLQKPTEQASMYFAEAGLAM